MIEPFKSNPLVSVLMTAYNRELYIGEAIESVLNSSYTNFELLIVDDASTDNTVAIAKSYQESDDRIKVFENAKNLGQFANRNKAAAMASGVFLKYLDSDDTITSTALEEIIKIMTENPEAEFGSRTMYKLGQITFPRESFINHFFNGNDILYVGPSGTIFKKSLFNKIGGFEEQEGILSDTLLMLKMAAESALVSLPGDFLFWRVHDQRVTIFQKDEYNMVLERHQINQKILDYKNCPFTEYEKKIVRRNLKNIFIRKSFYYIAKLKSSRRYLKLLELQGIGPRDFIHAFLPNEKLRNTSK